LFSFFYSLIIFFSLFDSGAAARVVLPRAFIMGAWNVRLDPPIVFPRWNIKKTKLTSAAQIFRILGDLLHMLSKGILIFAIHRNRSAEGVSLITQGLYAIVFCSRYLDLFRETSAWNAIFKVTYIVTSFYILAVMQWLFPRSREREISWKLGAVILGGCLALSPFVMMIFEGKRVWGFFTVRPKLNPRRGKMFIC
jgi:hypothetical protein